MIKHSNPFPKQQQQSSSASNQSNTTADSKTALLQLPIKLADVSRMSTMRDTDRVRMNIVSASRYNPTRLVLSPRVIKTSQVVTSPSPVTSQAACYSRMTTPIVQRIQQAPPFPKNLQKTLVIRQDSPTSINPHTKSYSVATANNATNNAANSQPGSMFLNTTSNHSSLSKQSGSMSLNTVCNNNAINKQSSSMGLITASNHSSLSNQSGSIALNAASNHVLIKQTGSNPSASISHSNGNLGSIALALSSNHTGQASATTDHPLTTSHINNGPVNFTVASHRSTPIPVPANALDLSIKLQLSPHSEASNQ